MSCHPDTRDSGPPSLSCIQTDVYASTARHEDDDEDDDDAQAGWFQYREHVIDGGRIVLYSADDPELVIANASDDFKLHSVEVRKFINSRTSTTAVLELNNTLDHMQVTATDIFNNSVSCTIGVRSFGLSSTANVGVLHELLKKDFRRPIHVG